MNEEQKALGVDLAIASKEMIEALIAEAVEPELFAEILRTNAKRPEIIRLLAESPETPEGVRAEASKILQTPVKSAVPVHHPERPHDMHMHSVLQRVQSLSVSERRLLAMRGGREVRALLLKDTNKEIVMSVLANPKITETEIEIFAHQRSIPDDALRAITKNREWMKNYGVLIAVITNPKTPAGVAIPLLTGLKLKDLVTLEKNKNIAEALRSAAKKLVQARKPH